MNVRLDGALTVRELSTGTPVTIGPAATLRSACLEMVEHDVGSLLAADHGGMRGIVTERDIVRSLADGGDPDSERVHDVMSERPISVNADASMAVAADALREAAVRHLVLEETDGTVVGVLSVRDLLAAGALDA